MLWGRKKDFPEKDQGVFCTLLGSAPQEGESWDKFLLAASMANVGKDHRDVYF